MRNSAIAMTFRLKLCSAALAVLFFSSPALAALDDELYENLETIEGARAALVQIDPNADFSVFKRVKLLDAFVAFRSGWERDQRRSSSRLRISQSEMERIKASVADVFNQVFIDVLEADDGYRVVDETGEDVLIIRPAIIDLDVIAPDTMDSRGATFTAETGSATLYIELFDSVSSQILGRAADRQVIRNAGDLMTWSNRASNTAGAQRLFRQWAQALRDFLDEHYIKKN